MNIDYGFVFPEDTRSPEEIWADICAHRAEAKAYFASAEYAAQEAAARIQYEEDKFFFDNL